MRKWILLFVIPSLGLVSMAPAAATPPHPASGTVVQTGSVAAPPEQAGGNLIVMSQSTFSFLGTFTGTSVAEERLVVHPNGLITFQSTEIFTGEVEGRTGTVAFRVVGTVVGDSVQGQFTILRGTAELENLRGQGTFEVTGVSGTYSGQIHFDPN